MVFFGQGVGLGEGGEGVGEGTGIMVRGQPAKINNRSISDTLAAETTVPRRAHLPGPARQGNGNQRRPHQQV